jgi:hypothetical protein
MNTKSAAEKLLIEPGTTLWTSHPKQLELIEPLPEGVRVVDRPEQATTALIFGEDAQSLRNAVAAHANRLADPETLWVAYPKGNRTDINRDSLWPILAEHGLRPIGQVSLGDAWSAMRFRPRRPGEAPFTGGAAS